MNYQIDKNIVLKYLGHKDQIIDDNLNQTIDEVINHAAKYINPTYTYGIFDIVIDGDNIIFDNKFKIYSKDLINLLKFSKKIILIACTIGSSIEQEIKYLSCSDIKKAFILDCCASVAVESFADHIVYNISEELLKDNLNLTNRYSAGYGDFSLSYQSHIINILDTQRRIGLYTDENNLLYPKKSITAVIGITNKNIHHTYYAGCENCAAKNSCTYRKVGQNCVSS